MSKGSGFSIHCQNCSFSHLCLPVALNKTEIESLDDIIERKKPLHKGDTLINNGDTFTSLFAVRTGSFKSFVTNSDGEEQITGFHFPGDIVGFEGGVVHEPLEAAATPRSDPESRLDLACAQRV